VNNQFREAAAFVFKRLLGEVPPDSYLADLEALNDAASEWHKLPEAKRLGFLYFEMPDLFEGVVQTGNLPSAISEGWAKNDAAKAFVSYIDERTGKRATLLMLQVIVLIQQAVQERKVNAAGGAT
jgi:hypothetical protein